MTTNVLTQTENNVPKYFLTATIDGKTVEREVTIEEFCSAERAAGFFPKVVGNAAQTTPATSGFFGFGTGVHGRVEYVDMVEPDTQEDGKIMIDLKEAEAKGWQLVPVKPTQQMLNGAAKFSISFEDIYSDMLRLAPDYLNSPNGEEAEYPKGTVMPTALDLVRILRKAYQNLRDKEQVQKAYADLEFATKELKLLGCADLAATEYRRHELLSRGFSPPENIEHYLEEPVQKFR